MARRARQRGHIEERPNGKFRARVYAGRDPLTGRERYLKKTVDTAKQAQAALTALLSQVDEQRQPRSRITVSQVIEKWFEVAEHEETTRERYSQLVRDYIDPTFGKMQASRLDAEPLETFYSRLKRCRRLCSGGPQTSHTCQPLASSSVRQVHSILRAWRKTTAIAFDGHNAQTEPPAGNLELPITPTTGDSNVRPGADLVTPIRGDDHRVPDFAPVTRRQLRNRPLGTV